MNTKISEIKNKITKTSISVTTTLLNRKIGELENKIPNHDAYISNVQLKKLTAENFKEKLKQGNLVSKNDFDNKLIIISFNEKTK